MDLLDHLQSAHKSLFRFEYLQDFDVPNEKESLKDWWNFLESKHQEGVITQRVRLVRKPLTKYTEWELETFKETVKYGDEIRILSEEKLTTEIEKLKDFWLIDDLVVLKMNYNRERKYLGFDIQKDVEEYINAKVLLLKESIPLTVFV